MTWVDRICTVLYWLSMTILVGMLAIAAYDFITVLLRQWGVW